MNKSIRILFIVLGAIVVLGGAGYFWSRDYVKVPDQSDFAADLDEIRSLAGEGPELPIAIRSIKVADGAFKAWMIIAGGHGDTAEFAAEWRSFQIVYPDRRILIDPVHDRELHEKFPLAGAFNDEAYRRSQAWVREADLILASHEHWDHVGGIASAARAAAEGAGEDRHADEMDAGLAGRALLSREQIESKLIEDAPFPDGFLESLRPARYDRYLRVAPGLVLIKAAGHTPGSQMIYVKTRDGRETIFVGDVVWNLVNVRELRGHGRLIGLIGGEDLSAKAAQIRWLHDIWKAGQVRLVVAHDAESNAEHIRAGWFSDE